MRSGALERREEAPGAGHREALADLLHAEEHDLRIYDYSGPVRCCILLRQRKYTMDYLKRFLH